ncbi:hypothetical protein, partial [Bacteroides thetaiotaomicron]|uniref:hypothetical protein n=1 Tax=Bacteroides thetaiotaomicron TaxID=818 RepID=UPI001D078AD0
RDLINTHEYKTFVHHHCNSCTAFSNISSLFSIFEVSTYSVHYRERLKDMDEMNKEAVRKATY